MIFEDFGEPLLDLLKEMTDYANQNTQVEISKPIDSHTKSLPDEIPHVISDSRVSEELQQNVAKPGRSDQTDNNHKEISSANMSIFGPVKYRIGY